jgi:prepilin-type N-terminal cleavage/methylation domain-containing protein
MRKVVRRIGRKQAFTLVELMIVVTIVAILALIAVPLYSANTVSAIMAEGVAGAGSIRNQLQVYRAMNGSGGYMGATLPVNSTTPGTLQLAWNDLQGKYFAPSDYTLVSVGTSTYTIKAGPPSQTTKVPSGTYYQINQNGSELGTYYTNQ